MDGGVGEGSVVQPYYDSLLAKVIAHGRDREEALARLAGALRDTALAGVRSNLAFLVELLRLPAFRDGQVSTHFIPEHFPGGWQPGLGREEHAIAAAFFLAARAAPVAGPWHSLAGFRVLAPAGHPGRFRRLLEGEDGTVLAVWGEASGPGWRMAVTRCGAPPPALAEGVEVSGGVQGETLELDLGGRALRLLALDRGGLLHLHGEAGWHAFRAVDPSRLPSGRGEADTAPDGPLTAPVPGVVAGVEVAAGDEVEAGAALLVLESMKMYQTLNAPARARVGAVHCAPGDAVVAGQVLLTLEAPEREAGAGVAQ